MSIFLLKRQEISHELHHAYISVPNPSKMISLLDHAKSLDIDNSNQLFNKIKILSEKSDLQQQLHRLRGLMLLGKE